MKIYAFDIDGTICTNTYGEYEKASPILQRIAFINDLYDSGNKIKLFTARGSTSGIDWYSFTEKQLQEWGVKFHELLLGKPEADFFIDDKGCNDEFWLWEKNAKNDLDKSSAQKFFSDAAISFSHLSRDKETLERIEMLGDYASKVLQRKGIIFLAGNGGSFSDSQHISAEFIGKLNKDRIPLPSIALGTNSSSVTAVANDYGYEQIFSRELEALGSSKDLLIVLSTSGESKNILKVLEKAKEKNMKSALLTGNTINSSAALLSDIVINTPKMSKDTASIQQIHIAIGHFICELAQKKFINSIT